MLSSRDPHAEAQIAEARGPEETPWAIENEAEFNRANAPATHPPISTPLPLTGVTLTGDRSVQGVPDVTLTGDEAANYLALRAAARRALEAQNAHASAGAELREAIQALCKAMAPG